MKRLSKRRRYSTYDHRVIKRFAWFPIICRVYWDDRVDTETRWLQTVYILQQFENSWSDTWWKNREFVTKDDYEYFLAASQEILEEER